MLLALIFVVDVVLIVICLILFIKEFKKRRIHKLNCQATITKWNEDSICTLSYEINGETYSAVIGDLNRHFHKGDTVQIYYNPLNPSDFCLLPKDFFVWWISSGVLGCTCVFDM